VTPVLCMITDRQRFGSGADDLLVLRVAAAARAGVHLVQIRERDLDGRPLVRLVGRCVDAVRSTATRVVVNDRVDVALAAGAHGVHLRADSVAASRVRGIVPPEFLIGRSVHSTEEASRVSADGGVDYLIFGAVFPTASKPGHRPAGTHTLGDVVAATTVPVLAVGGISPENAAIVARAGAAGVSGIAVFSDGPEDRLELVVGAIKTAFDTPRGVP
jgi:thiamine-phosphate diphosphorylase